MSKAFKDNQMQTCPNHGRDGEGNHHKHGGHDK